MKRLMICLTLSLVFTVVKAQQYPESQLYMANPYLINPGFTGYLTDLSVFAGANSPLSFNERYVRSYHVGINQSFEKNYLGVGGRLTYDQRDFFESIYVDASVAYRAVIAKKGVLNFGSDIGLINRTYSIGNLSPYVDLDDPTLTSDYYYQTSFKLGFGLVYYSTQMEAGVAVPYLIEGSEDFSGHYNAFFAYKFYLSNDRWVLKPNVLWVHYADGTSRVQGNVMIRKRDLCWAQLGMDNNQSAYLSTGWSIGAYELVYAHQLVAGDKLPYSNRSEVMLRIRVGKSNRELSHIASARNRMH